MYETAHQWEDVLHNLKNKTKQNKTKQKTKTKTKQNKTNKQTKNKNSTALKPVMILGIDVVV